MIVHAMSDLHLEIRQASPKLPGGEVLILAGDTIGCAYIKPGRTDLRGEAQRKHFARWFKTYAARYDHVLVVMGNHEHYGMRIDQTAEVYGNFLADVAPRAILMDDSAVEIGGVTFLGTTLWAPCDAYEWYLTNSMNDFKLIYVSATELFSTGEARARHKRHVEWLAQQVPQYERVVVISHHAPSIQSQTKYGAFQGSLLNSAYCGNLDSFIEAHPNIEVWVHGHTHISADYRIGQTRILANQHGYKGHEAIARRFKAENGLIDLETEEVEA